MPPKLEDDFDDDLDDDQSGVDHNDDGDDQSGVEDDLDAKGAEDSDEDSDDDDKQAAGKKAGKDDGEVDDEAQPRSRGGRRIQSLQTRLREQDEKNSRMERELEELRNQTRRDKAQDDQRSEEERLALMTVEERVEYKLNKALTENARSTQLMQFQAWDQSDKQKFELSATTDPRRKKYAAEVEENLKELREKRGMNASREDLFYYVLGKKVANNPREASSQQRKKAADNVRRQQTPTGSGRGDQAPQRRGGKTLEERLENVQI